MKQITKDDLIYYKITANFSTNNEYKFIIDWGDDSIDTILGSSPYYIAHSYSASGKYTPTVKIIDIQKGCWKNFTLDTIYVFGVELNAVTNHIPISGDPELSFTLNGFYDIEAGNQVQFRHKIYLGDGQSYQGNEWSTPITVSEQPYTITVPLQAEEYAYSEAGTYRAWVAIDLLNVPSASTLESSREISNGQYIIVGSSKSNSTQYKLTTHFTGVSIQHTQVDLGYFIDTANGKSTIEVDWGDSSSNDVITNVSTQVKTNLSHVYSSTDGAHMYSIKVTTTDSNNVVDVKTYSVYITPQVEIITQHGGACHKGTEQLSIIYSGKSPYAVYIEVVLRHDSEASSTPRCRLTTVTDTTVSTTSTTTISPSASTWFGAGVNMVTLTNVSRDFKISLDHNLSENSKNSMLIRAYVIDSEGTKSDKIILTRCGAYNIQSVGPKGL